MENNTVQVALAFCDPKGTYSRHAAVTMASIFANTSASVCVYIIHDDTLTEYNQSQLRAAADSFGQEVRFINVENMLDEDRIDVSKLTLDGARGTLFRLLIPDLIDVDRIIYLDCDIVVNMDIREFWNVPLGDNAVAAVRDVWTLNYLDGSPLPWRLGKAWECMGIARYSYFNAGVLYMNLKKIRASYDFLNQVSDFYAKYKKSITLADQDCLNYIFAGDSLILDEKFNHIRTDKVSSKDDLTGSIWHMAGGVAKPWAMYARPYVDDLYWQYLMKTPYCSSAEELITLMLKGLSASSHPHSSDCVKRLKKQLADNIFRAHIWTIPHILLRILKNRLIGER